MSAETDALIAYLTAAGVPHRVTDLSTPGAHSPRSLHYSPGTGGTGLAVDFAGPRPGRNTPQMRAVWDAFARVAPSLYELIYGDAPWAVLRGRRVPRSQVDPDLLRAHENHVHVAVRHGTIVRWAWPAPIPAPPAGGRPALTVHPPRQIGGDTVWATFIEVPALDADGNGWVELDLDPDKVVSIVPLGPHPARDGGYWNQPVFGKQDTAGKTVITMTEGPPGGRSSFWVWSVE